MQTLTSLQHRLENKKISSVELVQAYLQHIEKCDPQLNAFITVAKETALAAALKADEARAQGAAPLLAGIPIAHKDVFCTKGLKTSCGSKMLDNFISPYDATIVQKLDASGFITLGKTNMDEFAMGSSTENSFYGPCRNPWDLTRVPGGSSGGSAAAVAAGFVPAATGSDTGGSIRQPAAFCGLTGLKPTYGRVSRFGMVAYASSLDQAGPMAHTAEDCALLLEAMAGFDTQDATSAQHAVPAYQKTLNQSLQGLKIGLPNCFFDQRLDAKMGEKLQQALAVYESLGAKLIEIDLPHNHLSLAAYYIIAPAEASANLARFDGIRFGYQCEAPKSLQDLYERSRSEGFGPEVKRRILVGTYALSSGYYDAYYIKAQQVRRLIANDFHKAFEQVDIIAGPTTPTTAFLLGSHQQDPVSMYLADIYTLAVNLAGLPALSHPAGFVDGLPIGCQLIGKAFDEGRLLNAAHQYQQATDWHRQHPTLCLE